jgi:small basic protein
LHLLAEIFFNYYYYYLILAGLILLLAMIGAIILTIDTNYNSKIFLSGYKKDIRFFVTRVTKKRISFWKIKKNY